jgi:hypothetical protein
MGLTCAGIFGQQVAYLRFDPSDRLNLSSDFFYAESGWAFFFFDLVHIIVFALFAVLLARGSRTFAWLGTGWLIISSIGDMTLLAIGLFVNSQTAHGGNSAGSAVPFPGLQLIMSTLDIIQAFTGVIGYAFLAGAVFKSRGAIRIAGFFVLLGLPMGLIQIVEAGMKDGTAFLDTWVTPLIEFAQHGALAVLFFGLLFRRFHPKPAETPPLTKQSAGKSEKNFKRVSFLRQTF